jgi:hypothetical protein
MVSMKRFLFLGLSAAAFLSAADLSGVRNVYVLRMSKGLDQYLANHLTNGHVFQVVTDPKLADAILTDQIGEGFQAKLDELFPPEVEKPAEPEKPATPQKPATPGAPAATPAPPAATPAAPAPAEKQTKSPKPESTLPPEAQALLGDTVNKLASPATNSNFGRAKGIVFLVDAKSRLVIWSSYDPPKDSTSKELDRAASDVVNRIKRDLKKK